MANASALPPEQRLDGPEGLKLAYRKWLPAGSPRAAIVIVPGFNSHSGLYNWAAHQLVGLGIATYAIDLRGRGASDGERFYVASIDDYAKDIDVLMRLVRSELAGRPVFLLGHSAGGVTSVIYTLDHQSQLAGLICESFAYHVPAPDIVIAALKGLSRLLPHARVLTLNNRDFSRDPEVVAAMNADPLIAQETQPAQTLAALAVANERLKRSLGEIRLPVLILHGTADKATKPSGSREFFERAGSADKTLKLYEGGYHDLLNDTIRPQVFSDIADWLNARL
ncbi:MAG TPA: lysophospholipase [Devosia sp.]|nr:lysophospholipase [Devosia sp.]